LHTERATRGAARAFVRYEDLLEDWARELSRCAGLLDVPWLEGVDRTRYPGADALVDPGLRRSVVGWDDVPVPPALQAMAEDVWTRTSRLADPGGDDEEARTSLDAARTAFVEFYAAAEAIAQSSVTAVKPRGRAAAAASRAGKRRGASSRRRRSSPKRLVPRRYRELARRAMRPEALEAGRGLPLPLQMLQLIPPRYRERLPVPVLRAGHRVFRALRR
jgi:hypothetical protein